MHGRSPTLGGSVRRGSPDTSLERAIASGTTSLPRPRRIAGLRNLFAPTPAQKFSAGGLIGPNGTDEIAVRRLMAKLARRIGRREEWRDTLPSAVAGLLPFENPSIPAGYTYLLQFIAHDMIDSEVSLAEAGAGRSGFANTRYEPLSLDTLYGGGPDNTPQAYEFDAAFRDHMQAMPRIRLRLGRMADKDGKVTGACPFRDLGRALPIDVTDSGLRTGERLDDPIAGRRPWRTEVLIADVRNDSHALISQLTVLFHILHNHVLDLLGPPATDPLLAYRRFMCARFAVTMIYRAIIAKDVMRRILHRDVYQRYVTDGQPLLEACAADQDALAEIPVEFSHGAFRFGHAMVRERYRVNGPDALPFGNALDLSSVHQPAFLPMRASWHVDWSLFFETSAAPPNWSARIGPNASAPLCNTYMFPALAVGLDVDGVPNRDLLGASFADLWSVPALSAHLRTLPGLSALVPDYQVWRQPLADWLGRHADDFTADEIAILSDDPPMPFFVMFEAGHTLSNGVPTPVEGGRCLGPIGSLIIAETIFGALHRTTLDYESAGSDVRASIAAACGDLVRNPDALAMIPEITDMPGLLQFMKDSGAIDLPGPA